MIEHVGTIETTWLRAVLVDVAVLDVGDGDGGRVGSTTTAGVFDRRRDGVEGFVWRGGFRVGRRLRR